MNLELGLAVDQNGICYLNDYEDSGICVCGMLVGGAVQAEVPPYIAKFIEQFGLPVIPLTARVEVAAMSSSERRQYMEGL
jgi:hypothetical protein